MATGTSAGLEGEIALFLQVLQGFFVVVVLFVDILVGMWLSGESELGPQVPKSRMYGPCIIRLMAEPRFLEFLTTRRWREKAGILASDLEAHKSWRTRIYAFSDPEQPSGRRIWVN